MKLLQFFGYIKLPDDFNGDLKDAFQVYIDHKKSDIAPNLIGVDPAEDNEALSNKWLDTLWVILTKN